MGDVRAISESRWRRTAIALAWFTAVLAAVSGITAITSNEQIAIGLALATALAAATNAALNPADVARRHRTAALALRRLSNRLVDILFFQLQDNKGPIPAAELKQIRKELTNMDAEVLALNQDGMVVS